MGFRSCIGLCEERIEVGVFEVGQLDVDRDILFARSLRLRTEAPRGLCDMTLERPLLDLSRHPGPVHRVGVELLRDDVEAEAEGGVPDLLLSQGAEAAVDVLALDPGLDLLVPHEILLVERTQPIDALFELAQRYLELLLRVLRLRLFHDEPL
jgi:hypothetical protein